VTLTDPYGMWQPGPAYSPSGSKERNVRLTGSGKVYKAVSFIVAVIIRPARLRLVSPQAVPDPIPRFLFWSLFHPGNDRPSLRCLDFIHIFQLLFTD
jgi:hypothetical protein